MEKALKVLMMGGQRVGKSSALAAIMDAFMKPPINELLNIEDVTKLDVQDGQKQISIEAKLSEMKEFLSKNSNKNILVSSGKTSKIWHYKLSLSIPDRAERMSILFTDVNGEFYESGNIQQDVICELIEDYDAFIVAIDTTYLMESFNDDNIYVDSIINEKYNFVEDVHSFLSSINLKNNKDAKLVIFTPIKCEKWAKSDELDLVVKRIKEVYSTAIAGIKAHSNIRIEFLPIQTIGTMFFSEHLPAKIFAWKEPFMLFFHRSKTSKCSEIEDKKIRLADGTEMDKSIGELQDDSNAILILDTDIVRPNSWFYVSSNEYKPHNCEQLALHILDFMLRKYVDAIIRENNGENIFKRFCRWFINGTDRVLDEITRNYWSMIFGDIPLERMNDIINEMKEKKLIKYSGEGIEVFKDVYLLTK